MTLFSKHQKRQSCLSEGVESVANYWIQGTGNNRKLINATRKHYRENWIGKLMNPSITDSLFPHNPVCFHPCRFAGDDRYVRRVILPFLSNGQSSREFEQWRT